MPNHWHMVLWPREDGELAAFVRRLTHTHTMRWHTHYGSAGTGHLYQGRFPLDTRRGVRRLMNPVGGIRRVSRVQILPCAER